MDENERVPRSIMDTGKYFYKKYRNVQTHITKIKIQKRKIKLTIQTKLQKNSLLGEKKYRIIFIREILIIEDELIIVFHKKKTTLILIKDTIVKNRKYQGSFIFINNTMSE